jgi:hypothetical protein
MERRIGPRGRTKFKVLSNTAWGVDCLDAVAISASGIVVRRPRPDSQHPQSFVQSFELELPERTRRLQVRARLVRQFGDYDALRFVEIDDTDRLNIAEHLDVLHLADRLAFGTVDDVRGEFDDESQAWNRTPICLGGVASRRRGAA